MDDYERTMLEKFTREDLKHLVTKYLWEHFKVPSDVWYGQFWNGELNKMTDSLIANNGNLTLGEECTYDWDNFVIIELAEVYKQWQIKHTKTK